jgi:TM2 domain-containing membrane protein YozV
MSDETFHDGNQGWPSEPAPSTEPTQGAAGTQSAPVAFCQDCGKALTPETMRAVGTGMFCEPCLAIRMGVPASAAYAAAATTHTPNPTVAGLLGFIPGVGAMYNGQYAKGFVHLAIFALLISLSDHVSDVFGIFVFAWVCYMAFEAHHTAKARLLGLPLPNAFGFNDIGERMGFGKNWPYAAPGPIPPTGYATPTPPPYAAPPPYTAPTAGPDWVGYVPPTQFGAAAAADRFRAETEAAAAGVASALRDQAVRDMGYAAPYAQTYTGTAASEHAVPYVAPIIPMEPAISSRRLPVAAFLLIGLGALILLGTLMPEWSINGRWFPPVIFAVLSLLILWRRMHAGVRVLCVIRWPAVLMVLAIMSGLHAAYYDITFGMTCAVLLIVFGALLLLERTFGASPTYVAGAPIVDDAGRASFTSTGPVAPVATEAVVADETEKGGL